MTDTADDPTWISAWPDLLAFLGGLAVAWWGRWQATDLVWSLWLSSLVVGYAMIVWSMCRPAIEVVQAARNDAAVTQAIRENGWRKNLVIAGVALLVGAVLLAFFTVHFGGFHYVHAMLLGIFFPIVPRDGGRALAGTALFREVLNRYWVFLPSAFLAERSMFARRAAKPEGRPSVTAEAIAERKRVNAMRSSTALSEPYRQVMRMHFLIFFFFFAHMAHLENFALYATVYAVYFFPWRIVRRNATAAPAT